MPGRCEAIRQPRKRHFKFKWLGRHPEHQSPGFVSKIKHRSHGERITDQGRNDRYRDICLQHDSQKGCSKRVAREGQVGDEQTDSNRWHYVSPPDRPEVWIANQALERSQPPEVLQGLTIQAEFAKKASGHFAADWI